MERTQLEVEKDLNNTIEDRKVIENRLENTQKELLRLQALLEEDFDNLKSKQNAENNFRTELYEVQKHNIKQAISMDGVKKVFGEAAPFFMRFKEKTLGGVQAVKNFIDGTTFDRKWVDERYEDYKQVAIEKGDEIKSKEEFEKIALAIKESSNESEVSIYDRVSHIAKEVGTAKNTIKNVWQSLGLEEKVNNLLQHTQEDVSIENLDKKTVLDNWLNSVDSTENNTYPQYVSFVKETYGEDNFEMLGYKQGNFTAIMNRKDKLPTSPSKASKKIKH